MKFFTRFIQRNKRELVFVAAFGLTGVVFLAPLKLIYSESNNTDPERIRIIEETNKRRELIKSKYAQYKECKDPEEKNKLYQEINQIHVNRLRQMQSQSLNK